MPEQPADLHVPVLADRIVEVFRPVAAAGDRPSGPEAPVLIDGTLGLGGHTVRLLTEFPDLRVTGIDRDGQALELATQRVRSAGLSDRFSAVHAVFDDIGRIAAAVAPAGPVGMLLDLGVSSWQLDRPERGFAYAVDAPLDMRMDASAGPTAADVLNTYPAADLTRVLREYGEERFASRIAAAVVRERAVAPFRTSARLVELLYRSIPAPARRTGGHPAKRTFQALRIEVNDELGAIRRALPAALDALAVGGRIAVITFQSLEDRLVKRSIADRTRSGTPLDLPVELPGTEPEFRWLPGSGQAPTDGEIAENPRAASARLRVAERLRAAAT